MCEGPGDCPARNVRGKWEKASQKPDLQPSFSRFRLSLVRGGRTRDCGAASLVSFHPLNLSKTCASAAQRAACLAREAQATTVLATRKAGLCVSPFFREGVCKVVSPFAQVGSSPRLHIALCRMTLDLDCPGLVVGKQKPVPDVCSGALGSQGFMFWPINCCNGTFAVDVERKRIQSELTRHGRSVVWRTAQAKRRSVPLHTPPH